MRLIDADALEPDADYDDGDYWAVSMAQIHNAPTIEPRKPSEWIWKLADNGWADHICSNCGYTENTDIHVKLDWRYCPGCGSYMRRKAK